jgi:hypothetical protein
VTGHAPQGEASSAACDGIVLVTQQMSRDALYTELAGDEVAFAAAGLAGCTGSVMRLRAD